MKGSNDILCAGVDEAGRGCMFGPVYAAAVIWNHEIAHDLLKDSKKLTAKQRTGMFEFIKDNAIDYSVASASAVEIDKHNILNATQIAMHRALNGLTLSIDHICVDGNYFKYYCQYDDVVPHTCIVGGDNVNAAISAASILAKVSRDKYINDVTETNPEFDTHYRLNKNKGYCTREHMDGIIEYGRSPLHRMTFKLPHEKLG